MMRVIAESPTAYLDVLGARAAGDSALVLARSLDPKVPRMVKLLEDAQAYRDQPALLSVTSGTMGEPKLLAIRWSALDRRVDQMLASADRGTFGERTVVAVPLFHTIGLMGCLATLKAGGQPLVVLSYAPTQLVQETIDGHRATALLTSREVVTSMLEYDLKPTQGTLRSMWIGGQPIAPDWAKRVEAEFGVSLYVAYGATEVGLCATSRGDGQFRPLRQMQIDRGHIKVVPDDAAALGYIQNGGRLEPLPQTGFIDTGDAGALADGKLTLAPRGSK